MSSDTVLHTLPVLVWFVGSLLSCNKILQTIVAVAENGAQVAIQKPF